jgi:hypothetical protein
LSAALAQRVAEILGRFTSWLETFGEASFDHQSFYAGPFGRRAKGLYHTHRLLGTAAVAPLVFFEAFVPSMRRFFHHPLRFPIADAHYAMGHAFLYQATGNPVCLTRVTQFLDHLTKTRCAGFDEYCWGYPFDWVTRDGVIPKQTPLITTTPYAYEAFLHAVRIADDPQAAIPRDRRDEWKAVLQSIVQHAMRNIKDFKTSVAASSCSYTPFDRGGVVNAAAYRAFLLVSASRLLGDERCWAIAERNVNFVLEAQNPDGSWPYAVDGLRDFVDHFHTCFVMKALAKIHALTGHDGCRAALTKGVDYYRDTLFDAGGLPRPFARAPRLTVYKRELYDCAECINLCLLLRDRFPKLQTTLETVVQEIVDHWVTPAGSFRARRLLLAWDNVPMHRWGQAQMFRSLAYYLLAEGKLSSRMHPDVSQGLAIETSGAR